MLLWKTFEKHSMFATFQGLVILGIMMLEVSTIAREF